MSTVNIHEAKTHLSRLVDRAHAGEEIILAKAGRPYARLLPLADQAPRRPGVLKDTGGGRVSDAFFDPLPDEEIEAWEG